jgi:selenocysteine lyase/cysteine desulfurase
VRARCHALVERFVAESGLPATADEFGQMVAVELPAGTDPDELQRRLFDAHRIEVPCFEHNFRPLLRLSVQGYNDEADVDCLLGALLK